jgi:hypothetical protein
MGLGSSFPSPLREVDSSLGTSLVSLLFLAGIPFSMWSVKESGRSGLRGSGPTASTPGQNTLSNQVTSRSLLSRVAPSFPLILYSSPSRPGAVEERQETAAPFFHWL